MFVNRKTGRVWLVWRLAAFGGLSVGGFFGAAVLCGLVSAISGNQAGDVALVVAAVVTMGWVTRFCVRRFEGVTLAAVGLGLGRGSVLTFVAGCAVGVMMVGLCVTALWIVGRASFTGEGNGSVDMGGVGLVAVLCGCGALFEEMAARGYAFQSLARWNLPLAVVLLGVGFVAAHLGAAGAWAPIPMANLFLAHLLFTACLWKSGGLWLPAGVHAGWNFALAGVFGMTVSGMELGAPIAQVEVEPGMWSGNAFGLEGGLVVTGVLVVTTALVWWVVKKPRAGVESLMTVSEPSVEAHPAG